MEKNILPIGVSNTRQNFDLTAIGPASDTLFSNCFFEVYKDSQSETQSVYCIKRPGITLSNASGPSYGTNLGLGCAAIQPYTETNIYYAARRESDSVTTVWHWNGSITTGIADILTPTYKRVNFVNIGLPDDTFTCGFTAGKNLYLVKRAGAVTTATPHGASADLTRPVYLNNRVFVGDRVTGQIIQSNLGTYQTYSASEYLTVEAYGGTLVDLARYNNFIVAFKEYSLEFFEDVANQNGTVLARVGQAVQQVGCVHPNTIVDTGAGELIWLSTDESGQHAIKLLSNSFQVTSIEDAQVAKYLNLIHNYDGCYAYFLNANGHQFYVLNLKNNYTDTTDANDLTNVTFVYDMQSKLWSHWYSNGSPTTFSSGGYSRTTLGRWEVAGSVRSQYNTTYVQEYNYGGLYQLDDSQTTDVGSGTIPFRIRISNLDLGTYKRKFFNRIVILCDTLGITVPTFTLNMYRYDNLQYTTRTLFARPHTAHALGSAKTFSLEIESSTDTAIRISAINIDYDVGEGYAIS